MNEVKEELLGRAKGNRNPFLYTIYEEVAPVIDGLRSVDREEWAQAFSSLAAPHEERAAKAAAAGDNATARQRISDRLRLLSCRALSGAQFTGKLAAYRKSQVNFHKAAKFFDPPVERVEMPFKGNAGEGAVSVGLLRKPKGVTQPPVVVLWGGIDAFKEERPSDPYLAAGLATLAIDMPGVADAPLAGSENGERLWNAVFDYIASRRDLDAGRIGIHGGSTGGYWATKVAHTHHDRLRAAVNQGGPAHFAFQKDWIVKAQRGEYPFELAETLACAFGRSTGEEWIEYAPKLSLLDQAILDQPCAPLLCVNGIDDSVFPIADMYLLLEHGRPKSSRFYHSGHMGGGNSQSVIVQWLKAKLA